MLTGYVFIDARSVRNLDALEIPQKWEYLIGHSSIVLKVKSLKLEHVPKSLVSEPVFASHVQERQIDQMIDVVVIQTTVMKHVVKTKIIWSQVQMGQMFLQKRFEDNWIP